MFFLVWRVVGALLVPSLLWRIRGMLLAFSVCVERLPSIKGWVRVWLLVWSEARFMFEHGIAVLMYLLQS